MRKVVWASLFFVSMAWCSSAQQVDTCFTRNEIIKIGETIRNLELDNKILIVEKESYEYQLNLYKDLAEHDSLSIMLRNEQIELLNTEIGIKNQEIEQTKKQKFLRGFLGGVLTVTVAALALNTVL